MKGPRLTHLDEQGRARMVDVSEKPASARSARARARLRMSAQAAAAVRDGSGPKGEVLAVARLAGVQAAKQTAQLIPLAHPLPLSFVDVEAAVDAERGRRRARGRGAHDGRHRGRDGGDDGRAPSPR